MVSPVIQGGGGTLATFEVDIETDAQGTSSMHKRSLAPKSYAKRA
jgi:hypothetical protein